MKSYTLKNAGLFFALTILFFSENSFGQGTWVALGPDDNNTPLSTQSAVNSNLAINPSGIPYVVYNYDHHDPRMSEASDTAFGVVKRYTGGNWIQLGSLISNSYKVYNPSIVIDRNGIPYVAFIDGLGKHKITVVKFTGTAWTTVGAALFTDSADAVRLALDTSGNPYVAFIDDGLGGKLSVKKFTNGSWRNAAMQGFTAGKALTLSFAIGANNIPYVAFEDATLSNKCTVMKLANAVWQFVGTPGFTAGAAINTSLAVNSSGIPYVAFGDATQSSKCSVMKFSSGAWQLVGPPGFSTQRMDNSSLAFGKNNIPYIEYDDQELFISPIYPTVKKFSQGSWQSVGVPGYSWGNTFGLINSNICIDRNGNPYVAFINEDLAKCFVKEYINNGWQNCGPDMGLTNSFCNAGNLTFPAMRLDIHGNPFVIYNDFYYVMEDCAVSYSRKNWSLAGNPDFTNLHNFADVSANDKNGNIYVFTNSSFGLGVMKYNGSIWTSMGTFNSLLQLELPGSIAIDKNNTPYVAFSDINNSNKLDVMKYDGTNWQFIGSAGISSGAVNSIFLSVDANLVPYVFYRDGSGNAIVKDFTAGTWQTLPVISSAPTFSINELIISPANIPYAGYVDNTTKLPFIKQFVSGAWQSVGANAISSLPVSNFDFTVANKTNILYTTFSTSTYHQNVKKLVSNQWQTLGGLVSSHTARQLQIITDTSGNPIVMYQRDTLTLAENNYRVAYAKKFTSCQSFKIMAGNDTTICPGTSATLIAYGGYQYTWQPGNLSGNVVTVSPGSTTKYTVTGVNGACSAKDSVQVNVSCPDLKNEMGLTSNIPAKNSFSVYPNPATNQLNIEGNLDEPNAEFILFNLLGQRVYSTKLNSGNTYFSKSIDVSKFQPGIYEAVILTGTQHLAQKIILD